MSEQGSAPAWAVGYLRVSTEEQAEGYGLDAQRAAIEDWADRTGVPVGAFYEDVGVSGATEPAARKGLTAALTALMAKPGALVVARMDRLARDVGIQETLIPAMEREGCSIVSVAEPDLGSSNDPSRVLVRQILAAMAQHERALIGIRCNAGKAIKRARGGWVGGPPPFGFRLVNGNLATDPVEWPTLVRLVSWHEQRIPWTQIARLANERGLKTREGGPWWRQTVTVAVQRIQRLAGQWPGLDEALHKDVAIVQGPNPIPPGDRYWATERWRWVEFEAEVTRDASVGA